MPGARRRSRRAAPLGLPAALLLVAAASAPAAQGPLHSEADKPTADPFVGFDGQPRTAGELAMAFANWVFLPSYGLVYQYVDTGAGDPAVLVAVMPGFSGSPTRWERFQFQFPSPPPANVEDRALVIGFHGYSITEQGVINNSSLPAECAARGYYLLAPLGLDQENWANEASQLSLDATLAIVDAFFDFNPERIYAAGFSMGGCNALSYSLRHQDPGGYRVAGVISHTATLDLLDSYAGGSLSVRDSLEDALGGSPVTAPFAYERISPLVGLAGAPDPDLTNVSNLLSLPIYHHVNLLDPDSGLLAQNAILKDWLLSSGANAVVSEVVDGTFPKHSWSTLDMGAALDFVEAYSLPPAPDHAELFVDRTVPYLYTEPRALAADEVARYHVDVDTVGNAFALEESKHVEEIAFDLAAMGLDPTKELTLDHETIDGTDDTIVLKGYPKPPSSVLTGGGAPQSWSHDALAEELTVTPNASGTASTTVIGTPAPSADFSASVVSGPAPLSVDFTDESWGCVTSWNWSFGDTGTSPDPAPTHVYATPGTYDVTLIVMGPGGSAGETKIDHIEVLEPPPVAEFTADVTSGDAPLTVSFSDLSRGGAVTDWSWDFGDTNGSTDEDPQHVYSTPGTYTVSLTVTGPGGSDAEVETDYISVQDPTPVAAFTSDVTGGEAPQEVQFTDLSSGTITSWSWDFGDGSPLSSDPSPLHEYTAAGDYTVSLTVSGPGGLDTATQVDYVSITDPAPVAEFSADVLSGTAPLAVQFTDESAGTVTQWDWSFGDLGTSTAENPQHTYVDPGNYTVILAVTGPGGSDLEVKAAYITVH